jgi:hypothetical protein
MHAMIRGTAETQIKREDVTSSKNESSKIGPTTLIQEGFGGSTPPLKITQCGAGDRAIGVNQSFRF